MNADWVVVTATPWQRDWPRHRPSLRTSRRLRPPHPARNRIRHHRADPGTDPVQAVTELLDRTKQAARRGLER